MAVCERCVHIPANSAGGLNSDSLIRRRTIPLFSSDAAQTRNYAVCSSKYFQIV